jgi:uncharacterized membrane protein YraQ (UPF0718 family)
MTFGVLFAAVALTMLSLMRRKSFDGAFANSALGTAIGAPLGVCVNCAAPIAKGLHTAGLRAETTIAMMIASPTMNVIVLTILLALFPFYMFAIKLSMTLLFLLVALPLLSKSVLHEEFNTRREGEKIPGLIKTGAVVPLVIDDKISGPEESWVKAIGWFVSAFTQNLWFIVRKTVPLMLLAGFLGAVAITLLPWETIVQSLPDKGAFATLSAMAGLALFGIFLPVPIAFDVIVTAILMGAGLPVKYAMILLFTLGVFSVYSFLIVRQAMSLKVAVTITLTLALLGAVSGGIANYYEIWERQKFMTQVYGPFSKSKTVQRLVVPTEGMAEKELVDSLKSKSETLTKAPVVAPDGIVITRAPFNERKAGAKSGKPFERVQGKDMGIDLPYTFSGLEYISPFALFRSISSGDVHNDGWIDIVVASHGKVALYANVGGRFVRQKIEIVGLNDLRVVSATLVDLNNDGWLDLFIATYLKGNYVVYSDKGLFSSGYGTLKKLPTVLGSKVTLAPAFGDLDNNGELDIALGNYASIFAVRAWAALISARNGILFQSKGRFKLRIMDEYIGDTLASYMGDFNGDNKIDLIIGNDLHPPDIFYYGDGKGNLKQMMRDDNVIPVTPSATMSIALADIDNDLSQEIYIVGISESDKLPHRANSKKCDELSGTPYASDCADANFATEAVREAHRKMNPASCDRIENPLHKQGCVGLTLLWTIYRSKDSKMCETFPSGWSDLSSMCRKVFETRQRITNEDLEKSVPLVPKGDGKFENRAKEMGLEHAGWGWNSQFADLNNDEWLDLLVVNGHLFQGAKTRESNYFFLNEKGKRFTEASERFGLGSFRETIAYTYIDIDNDGDLDIVSVPMIGPLWVYKNQMTDGHAIKFELRDNSGNRFGIGAKVIIHYGENGKLHQIRQIEASGGFHSFNEAAAHFGLGPHDSVSRVEVIWPDGERTELNGPFQTGWRYRITHGKDKSIILAELNR